MGSLESYDDRKKYLTLSGPKKLFGCHGPDTVVHFVGSYYRRRDYSLVRRIVEERMLSWVDHNTPKWRVIAPSIDLYIKEIGRMKVDELKTTLRAGP